MKNVSLKVKLTMLYTFFMLLIICAVLALLLSLSSREVLSASKTKLRERVNNSTEDIVLRDGELKIKSDFYSVSGDIYLSLYDTSHYFLYGKIPYGFNTDLDFADGEVRTVTRREKTGMFTICLSGWKRGMWYISEELLRVRMRKQDLRSLSDLR